MIFKIDNVSPVKYEDISMVVHGSYHFLCMFQCRVCLLSGVDANILFDSAQLFWLCFCLFCFLSFCHSVDL